MHVRSWPGLWGVGFLTTAAWAFFACVGDSASVAVADDGSVPNDGSQTSSDATGTPQDGSAVDSSGADGSQADASGVADSSTDASGWTPALLGASLAAWLDSDRGLPAAGTHVQSWVDQSGAANSAVQGVGGNQPLVAAGPNGHAAVKFDGLATFLTIPDSLRLRWGTGEFAIYVVAAYINAPSANNATGYGWLWSKTDSNAAVNGVLLAANRGGLAGTPNSSLFCQLQFSPQLFAESGTNGYNNGAFHVFGARRTGNVVALRADGNPVASVDLGVIDVSATAHDVFIGAAGTGAYLDGSIAEIIAVSSTLSNANQANLEAYLKAKFGL